MKSYFGFHVLFTVNLAGVPFTEMTIFSGIRSERFELASILAHPVPALSAGENCRKLRSVVASLSPRNIIAEACDTFGHNRKNV